MVLALFVSITFLSSLLSASSLTLLHGSLPWLLLALRRYMYMSVSTRSVVASKSCSLGEQMVHHLGGIRHYYRNDFAQHCTFALRGGLLFVSAAVNPTIYRGGHFLFTVTSTFARHGKSIFRSGQR